MPNDHKFQPFLLLKFISFQIFMAFKFIYWEIHLWKERSHISSKILVLWLPWDYPFTIKGKLWVLTSWCCCQGTRFQIFHGKNENIFQEDNIYVGKHRFLHSKEVVFFPWRFHINFQQGILNTTSWLSREHTQEVTLIIILYIVWNIQKV